VIQATDQEDLTVALPRFVTVIAVALVFAGATPARSAGAAAAPATRKAQAATAPAAPRAGPERFEKSIAAYEAADRINPPPKGAILFTGSSTIGGWKTLASDFPDHQVINRGFGGSTIAEATHFADRIVIPYAPKMVLIRSGTNDIHAGKSADEVFEDFKAFVAKVHAKLPETDIVFIGLAPAPSRWSERDENRRLNEMVRKYAQGDNGVSYIDTYDTTVTPDGQPREELFVKDRLHFNAEGYKLLAERVRPHLPQ
jgi:lysophospholipase L1-like esterase